jgi:hypothetical protein
MSDRLPLSAAALVMAVGLWAPILIAQAPSDAAARLAANAYDPTAPSPKGWTPPRTSWGDPDLQGYWLNFTYTPLERPKELAGKPLYTVQEAVEAFTRAVAIDASVDPTVVHYDFNEYGMKAWQSPSRPNRRTALIVDPPDGRIPALTPEAQKRQAATAAGARSADVASYPGLYTRCIIGYNGWPRTPVNYQGETQFVQVPGYVLQIAQANSDVRVIPLDGRPHLPQNIRTWSGDARGHWEGNTLVVDTTNLNAKSRLDVVGDFYSDNAHIVERFIFVDANTLTYEATITDPKVFTRPWTLRIPERRMPDDEFWEFACHEGNLDPVDLADQINGKPGQK